MGLLLQKECDRVQAQKERRRQEEIERRELDIKNRMAKMGNIFAAEKKNQKDFDSKVSREMAQYNAKRDEEMAKRRSAHENQRQDMIRSIEEMRLRKAQQKKKQEEVEKRFALEIKRQDDEFRRKEMIKAERRAKKLLQ